MPLMYLESMVDGAMKGVGEQKAAFRYSVWDSILRIGGVVALLPRFGMKGFLAVILLSSLYTCIANTGRLLFSSGTQACIPPLAGCTGTGSCCWQRRRVWRFGRLLADGFAARNCPCSWPRWGRAAALTAAVFLLAAWPLGLGEEVKPSDKAKQACCGHRRRQTGIYKILLPEPSQPPRRKISFKFSGHSLRVLSII